MSDAKIRAVDWENVGHRELIRLCREWHSEAELFCRILKRSLELVFIDAREIAEEIGEDTRTIEDWLDGKHLPQEEWMLLILSDVIQTRLEVFADRLAYIRVDSTRHN